MLLINLFIVFGVVFVVVLLGICFVGRWLVCVYRLPGC